MAEMGTHVGMLEHAFASDREELLAHNWEESAADEGNVPEGLGITVQRADDIDDDFSWKC